MFSILFSIRFQHLINTVYKAFMPELVVKWIYNWIADVLYYYLAFSSFTLSNRHLFRIRHRQLILFFKMTQFSIESNVPLSVKDVHSALSMILVLFTASKSVNHLNRIGIYIYFWDSTTGNTLVAKYYCGWESALAYIGFTLRIRFLLHHSFLDISTMSHLIVVHIK